MTRHFALLFALVSLVLSGCSSNPKGLKSTPVAAMVCSEQTIRDAVQNHNIKVADDSFFWSGAFDKPLIGKAEREEGAKKLEVEAPRKNQVSAQHPQRIDVSKSGDMAYEYGTGELSFDDQKTGKHVAFRTHTFGSGRPSMVSVRSRQR